METAYISSEYTPAATGHEPLSCIADHFLVHQQGIIHRDIKPANLLWTDDRRQVKIGDFGVSQFCYAQRLASGGADLPDDPLLQDDADLSFRAGSPAFLAPEVVWEHTRDPTTGRALFDATDAEKKLQPPRPPITAAIDFWALGVTLFCLVAGDTPFLPMRAVQSQSEEFALYAAVCNNAWEPPARIGYEGAATADGEGAQIVALLDRFLTKDYRKRITLDGVKVRGYMRWWNAC